MVILLEAKRQQEEAEKESALGARQPNSAHQAGGGSMQGETVEYTNINAQK